MVIAARLLLCLAVVGLGPALYVLALLAYDEATELFGRMDQHRLRSGVSGLTLIPVSNAKRPAGAATTTTT